MIKLLNSVYHFTGLVRHPNELSEDVVVKLTVDYISSKYTVEPVNGEKFDFLISIEKDARIKLVALSLITQAIIFAEDLIKNPMRYQEVLSADEGIDVVAAIEKRNKAMLFGSELSDLQKTTVGA